MAKYLARLLTKTPMLNDEMLPIGNTIAYRDNSRPMSGHVHQVAVQKKDCFLKPCRSPRC